MCVRVITAEVRPLGLLTALGGQLAVELWELRFHRNADGASQEVAPA